MHRNNFTYLLVALLIFIIVLPVAYDLELVSLRISRLLAIPSLLAVGIWSLRGTGRRWIIPLALHHVGPVDPGRGNPDQYFAVTGRGQGQGDRL